MRGSRTSVDCDSERPDMTAIQKKPLGGFNAGGQDRSHQLTAMEIAGGKEGCLPVAVIITDRALKIAGPRLHHKGGIVDGGRVHVHVELYRYLRRGRHVQLVLSRRNGNQLGLGLSRVQKDRDVIGIAV